jgi:uncharacterized protein
MKTDTLIVGDASSTRPNDLLLADTASDRLAGIDWAAMEAALTTNGYAVLPQVLTSNECQETVAIYDQEEAFRSRIVMERYAFGRGEYKYFNYPLPTLVQRLRTDLYGVLAPIANRWHTAMRLPERFPPKHSAFIESCNADGQHRPTPLMLRYGPQDYCCLHQDLYGAHVFPFQVVFLLSEPSRDFTGGELLLTESDPRRPGRAEVIPLVQGQAVIFAVNSRPVRGGRGIYRASLRHGVSRLHWGHRNTLGIIFHDAK